MRRRGGRGNVGTRDATAALDSLAIAARTLADAADVESAAELICRSALMLCGGTHARLTSVDEGRDRVLASVGVAPGRDQATPTAVTIPLALGDQQSASVDVVGAPTASPASSSSAVVIFQALAAASLARAMATGGARLAFGRAELPRLLATVSAGDAVVVFRTEVPPTGSGRPRTADRDRLALLLGVELRSADQILAMDDTQLVVVLVQLRAPVEVVVARALSAWLREASVPPTVGAAVHLDGGSPLQTLAAAEAALQSAAAVGIGQFHIASPRRVG